MNSGKVNIPGIWQKLKSDLGLVIISLLTVVVILVEFLQTTNQASPPQITAGEELDAWVPPSLYYDTTEGEKRKLLVYGEELIAHTAKYLGPRGSVAQISNGMNCQNCHLNAGKKNWGNNYSLVNSTYPRFRDRSGGIETIYKRVSDCFERSLNGSAPDSNSREYKAIETYIKWVGKDVQKGEKPVGSGIEKLPFLDRAADPVKGQQVYITECQSCHGASGEGQVNLDGKGFVYPPLWGPQSYNIGAGLFRLSNFAGYVKNNMPLNLTSHANSRLSTEQAWDVAAFVNSQPRPVKDLSKDWPDITKKPFDHPFGPYADEFSEAQHKFGPYQPILAKREK
ncbi:MAG TPA: c-type cytochrome [Chitinophagaceae bacterium]|nr:c-type cytochrome [Chitinophagaceae bacterium]